MAEKVLVLNASFLPINITSWRRAMSLIYKGKAIGVVYNGKVINGRFRLPEVIRLTHYVFVPFSDVVFSRKNIFLRDNHTCQYCGARHPVELTMDHIVPKSEGGAFVWENLVCACRACNSRKRNRTLAESGMKLRRQPKRPDRDFWLKKKSVSCPPEWEPYLK